MVNASMGRRMSFTWFRGQTWFFRRAVPFRLRPIIGKKEVRISLKTGDAQLAKRRAIAEAAKVDRMFAEAEAAVSNPTVRAYKMIQEWRDERARNPPRVVDEETGREEDDPHDSVIVDRLEEDERGERRLDP